MIFRFAALFFTLIFSTPAFAADPLIFRTKITDIREQSVIAFMTGQKLLDDQSPYALAATDLNDDGVDEWIVRQDTPQCDWSADCSYYLLGLKKGTPALLGSFLARKVGIADEKVYGVRKLFVYNNKNDDFASQSYAWSPASGTFEPQ